MTKIIYSLDPRLKILAVVFISLFLFTLNEISQFIVPTLLSLILLITSKLPISDLLKKLRPFIFFFAFILLMYINTPFTGVIVVWRFFLLILIAAILTYTTTTSEMVYALEKLFYPLKLFNISPRNISVMVAATIRFIPLLMKEASTLRDAQKSRALKKMKFKHLNGFVQNLLRKTFTKASFVADAMDSRCYRDHSYTTFKELKFRLKDFVAAFVILAFVIIL